MLPAQQVDHAQSADRAEVVSDRNDGPYAGIHRFSALEFIARWVDHVPDRYETRVRYYGAYATRWRIWWQRRGISLASVAAAEVVPSEPAAGWPALRARVPQDGWWDECVRPRRTGEIYTGRRALRRLADGRHAALGVARRANLRGFVPWIGASENESSYPSRAT